VQHPAVEQEAVAQELADEATAEPEQEEGARSIVRGDPTQMLRTVRTRFEESETSFVEPYVRTLNDVTKRRHVDPPGL
jgi:hypothetical protein